MATVVNTRDVKLQATSPRVLPISLPSNVIVPTAQVDGLPAIVLNSKVLYLRTTSQVFQIAKSGTVSPASINLAAVLKNTSGTVTFTVASGTATLTVNADGTRSLNYADMATDSVTITASVTDGGNTYSDTTTLVKLREGTDTLNMILSNEAQTLPADSTGVVTTYVGAGTNITLYAGTTDVTSSWTITKADSTGVTSSLANNQVTVTNMTSGTDSGYVDITAAKSGFSSITRRFSLSKSKAGTNGTSGSNGANGQRGTVNIAISGYSSWSDTAATNAVINAGYGYPQNRDIVTLYSGSSSTSKFYNGGSWVSLDAYINGNMLVSGTLSASVINGGTLSGASINIAGNFVISTTGYGRLFTSTLYRCTSSNGDAPGIPALTAISYADGAAVEARGYSGPALTITGSGSGIVQSSGGNNSLYSVLAASDNAYDLGSSGNRWRNIYAANGTISTSDQRTKTDIEDSNLGLDFIKALRPAMYRQVVGENVVVDHVPAPSEIGPMQKATKTVTPKEGKRQHYGLIAQEVRQALLDHGAGNSGIWCLADSADPESGQALRYEELIGPMIKAMQEMAAVIADQGATIEKLKTLLPPG